MHPEIDYRIFYNPIWTPDEESINLLCCLVPEHVVITTPEQLLPYLEDRYRHIIIHAYNKDSKTTCSYYHEYIDENMWYNDGKSLADCFLASNIFASLWLGLVYRAREGVMPDYVIGYDEITLLDDFCDLCMLIHVTR